MIPFLITSVYGKVPNLWSTMGRSYKVSILLPLDVQAKKLEGITVLLC